MTDTPGARVAIVALAGALALATLVWSSGEDMLVGWMLVVVVGGWGLLALQGLLSFGRAARVRGPRWMQEWAVPWLGCVVALLASVGLGAAGVPEDARIGLSRDALVAAGERVLAGEDPDRAGLYGLRRTDVDGGCALLEISAFAVSSSGFAYCPGGGRGGYETIGGGLYKYAFD